MIKLLLIYIIVYIIYKIRNYIQYNSSEKEKKITKDKKHLVRLYRKPLGKESTHNDDDDDDDEKNDRFSKN